MGKNYPLLKLGSPATCFCDFHFSEWWTRICHDVRQRDLATKSRKQIRSSKQHWC